MANEKVLISGIEYKIRKLIEQFHLLKDENKQLKQEVEVLKQQITSLQEKVNKTNSEILNLTLASALKNKFGVEKGCEIIDELLKEIDRSIDVISK